MSARRVAGRHEERAQRAVGEPVGGEVQVVEDHERAQLQARVHRAARGASDHRRRAEVVQGPDVGAVGHLVRQPHVAGAVAGDMKDVDAREAPARDLDRPEGRLVQQELGIRETGQRVGPGSGDDADRHGARSYSTATGSATGGGSAGRTARPSTNPIDTHVARSKNATSASARARRTRPRSPHQVKTVTVPSSPWRISPELNPGGSRRARMKTSGGRTWMTGGRPSLTAAG